MAKIQNPPAINCEYQVRVRYNTWQCMSKEEYKEYSTNHPPASVWEMLAIAIIIVLLPAVLIYLLVD